MTAANIQMHDDAPSAQVVKAANAEFVVQTAAGIKITLKKPGVLTQFKTIEMLGGDAASNLVFVNMVLPVTFVVAIDGEPVPRCSTRRELDALIQRLDEDGIEAVMKGVPEHFGAPNPERDAAAVKN